MVKRMLAFAMSGLAVIALGFLMTPNAQSARVIPQKSGALNAASRGINLDPSKAIAPSMKAGKLTRRVEEVRRNYELTSRSGRFIVTLRDAAIPNYDGKLAGFPATQLNARGTSATPHRNKIDIADPSVVAYRGYLIGKRDLLLQRFERDYGSISVEHTYEYAVNGFSARMDDETASKLAMDPEVLRVEPVVEVPMDTATTPAFVGAEAVFNGEVDGIPYKGEGLIVGILDSGINHFHPSFAATGDDGYTVQPPPGLTGYLGECATRPELCNDKLIGAYVFAGSAAADIVEEEFNNPASADIDGHGSHVAATAAGNVVFDVSPFDPLRQPSSFSFQEVSGIAPHANLISYKVCHVRSCPTADILAGMNQAIADGADVVNKSISSASGSPWVDTLSQAYLAARAAGVFVANSAGNDGPDPGTAGRINSSPWVAGVAATTHPRGFELKTLSGLTGGDTAPPADISGRGVTGAYTGTIVYAGDYDNGLDAEPEQCLVPFPPGTFSGEIVMCDRGAIARVDKGVNVLAGGAGGFILGNLQGGATSINDDIHALPAIHVNADDADALRAWLATGTGHTGTIGAAVGPINDLALADTVIGFSSRGPYEGFDILAPNIAAPGVDILAAGAGLSDEVFDFILANYPAAPAVDSPYGIIGGTSMASPHVAGAAALLKQARPTWTDAEVLSALQTTAVRSLTTEGVPATPLDIGAGRIQIDRALRAGLLLDETPENFELADPQGSPAGDPRTLNVVGLVDRQCVESCSWTRTVSAVTDDTWDLTTNQPWLSVTPASITLAAGETATITVTADVSGFDTTAFQAAEVLMTPRFVTSPVQHLTVSVAASSGSIPEVVELLAARDQGSRRVRDVTSIAVESFSSTVFGPFERVATAQSVGQDSDNSSPYDDTTDGVVESFVTVPAGALRFVVETFDSSSPDLDLFVGVDFNGNGAADANEEICFSATATNAEVCDIALGGVNPELPFWVLVQNWQASDTPPDSWQLGTAIVEATEGSAVTVNGPAGALDALVSYNLDFEWDLPATEGQAFYGFVEYFADAAKTQPIGFSDLNVIRVADDSSISVAPNPASTGDVVDVTIEVGRNFNEFGRNLTVTHTVPDGLTLVGGSINQGGAESGGTITWSLPQPGFFDPTLEGAYSVTTSLESADCVTPFGVQGYVDFAAANPGFPFEPVDPQDDFSAYSFTSEYFNAERNFLVFATGGFMGLSADALPVDGTPQPFPNVDPPNDLIAALWNDWTVVSARDDSVVPPITDGLYVGAFGGGILWGGQWQNVQLGTDTASFEIFYWTFVDDTPGAYEIITTIGPNTTATGLQGLENATGTIGTNRTGPLPEDLVVCYDFVGPSPITLAYQATVDGDATGVLTLESTDSDDVPNTVAETRSTTLTIENDPGVLVFNPATYDVDEDDTVTVTVERVDGGDGPVTVDVVSSGGTATAGTDYTAVSESLSWADGERGAKTLIVTTLADGDPEGTETIALTFENLTGASSGGADTAVVSIADASDPGTLQFEAAVASVSESETEVVVNVTRTGGTAEAVSVEFTTADGTATAGEDYTANSGTLNFADGDATAQIITVALLSDGVFEGDETFSIALSNPLTSPLGDPATIEVTITEDDAPASIGFGSASASVSESGGSIVLEVARTANSAGEVTVNYQTVAATATEGEDYTASSGTLTWADGVDGPQEITIDILDDAIGEPDETFVVELSDVSANATLTNSTATVTIEDDDTSVQFVTTSATVAEGDGAVSLDVERTGTVGETTVDYRVVYITASPGDIANTNGTLTWADGVADDQTIVIDIVDDALVEGAQQFQVELVNPINASLGDPVLSTVTITDNDSSVELATTSVAAGEGDGTVDLAVVRVGSSVGPVTVDFATVDGSAAAGSDYTVANGTVSFADGDTAPKTISVTLTDDALIESPEDFTVVLSNAVGVALGENSEATVTIVDNDATADTVGFVENRVTVSENDGNAVLTVERTAGTGALAIAYATGDGSALAGSEYEETSGTLTWADGETDPQTISIPLLDDEIAEMPSSFFVFIPGLGAESTAEVTITDDSFEVGFAAASDVTVDESVGTVSFTVEASGDGDGGTVEYGILADTADASDVTNATGTITYTGGDLSARTITVDVVDDNLIENEESLSVVLFGASGEATVSATAGAAVLTITDDDVAGTVELAAATAMATEGNGTVTITVNRTGGIDGAATVDYATAAGTADATDFTAASGTLSWVDQDGAPKTFTIDLLDDSIPESMETFTVTLSNATGAALGTQTDATVTVVDDDGDFAVVAFAETALDGNVDDGSVELTVVRSANTGGPVTVDYATADGTATAGDDYSGTTGTLSWADGEGGARTITVPLSGDGDASEDFTVALSNVTGAAALGVDSTATVTLVEGPPADVPAVIIARAGITVGEGDGSVEVSLSLDAPSAGMTSVSYTTVDGTATAGSDYTAASGSVTWMDGEDSAKTFTVDILDDSDTEPGESFTIELTSDDLNVPRDTVGVIISDNDGSSGGGSGGGGSGGGGSDEGDDDGGCAATPVEPFALLGVAFLFRRRRRREG